MTHETEELEQRDIAAPSLVQGFFFDCETSDPAKALVVELALGLCNAPDALVSIDLLVTFDVPDCANALPAKLR